MKWNETYEALENALGRKPYWSEVAAEMLNKKIAELGSVVQPA